MPVNSFEDYPMSWKPDIKRMKSPIYKSIANALEEDIKKGILKSGDKLPPQRELADFLDINLSTITRAFKICTLKGLISGTTGKGSYVSVDTNTAWNILCSTKPSDNCINMGAIHPLYNQNKYVAELMKKILKKTNVENILKYSYPAGLPSHRLSGQKYLKGLNINVNVENVMVTSGSQNSLAIILMSLFNSGDKIATNPLTYPGIKTLANMLNIRLIPIPLYKNKIDVNALDSLCKNEGVKGLYLIPDIYNPTTNSMTNDEKQKIAEVIKRNNTILIEDGIYGYTNSKKDIPLSEVIPEQSIYIASISKSFCAGLRVSFMAVADRYKEKIEDGIHNVNIITSPFNVEVACQLIETNIGNQIIKERMEMTTLRNSIVDKVLKDKKVLGDKNSSLRWLILPKHINCADFEMEAKERGVIVYCVDRFVVGNSYAPSAVRLSVCTPKDNEELIKGLFILNSIIDELVMR